MSAKDFLKALACELARQGLETWQGMNEQSPMDAGEQAYLVYQMTLYLQGMNEDAAANHMPTPEVTIPDF